MVAWPLDLPQRPRHESLVVFDERPIASFQADIGRPIRRKRQTDYFKCWSGIYVMNKDQLESFRDFYRNTIGAGLDSFTMIDPHSNTGVTVEFKDDAPPQAECIASNADTEVYHVQMTFRVLS